MLDFLTRWLSACRGPREGAIALLESLPLGGDFSELPRIERHMKRAGWPVVYGDPKQLVQRRDGVYLKGRRVAYVYRDFSFEDQPRPNDRRMQAFRRLWRDGQVGPGLAADFDQKGLLECFTSEDYAAFFSRRETALLREHVPWTRVLSERRTRDPRGARVDLPSYAVRRREDLVLKPSWSAGGEGILIGRHTAAGRWRSTVERAVARPGSAAVQAYIDNPPIPCAYFRDDSILMKDCRFTIGAFHDGSHFGFHMRVSPNHIVNVAQGGALVPLYFGR